MLRPACLQTLRVDPAHHPRGQSHLSAASGLVRAGACLYLVADDEHHLAALPRAATAPTVALHRFRERDLPQAKGARKRRKPDLEALALVPPAPGGLQGRLLALGSGSRPNREAGFVWPLEAWGALAGTARPLDLAPLYAPLHALLADLNVEGAFFDAAHLVLLHRGHLASSNACITFDAPAALAWLDGAAPPAPLRIAPLALGALDGVAYGVTDGLALPAGDWLVSAVAEATDDSYRDGACAGSLLARVAPDGTVRACWPLAGAPKVEGLCLDGERLLMVTDADDPDRASELLALPLAALAGADSQN